MLGRPRRADFILEAGQCFSECGPWTNSIINWKFVKDVNSWALSQWSVWTGSMRLKQNKAKQGLECPRLTPNELYILRITLSLWYSCQHLPGTGFTGRHHHVQFSVRVYYPLPMLKALETLEPLQNNGSLTLPEHSGYLGAGWKDGSVVLQETWVQFLVLT